MDYKKLYEETIEKVKGLIEKRRNGGLYVIPIKDIEDSIPELADSEDERIRNRIIDLVNARANCNDVEPMIAWLEKQGEQKYTQRDIDDAYLKGISDAKKELEKQDKQKSIWSEEDEVELEETIYFVKEFRRSNLCCNESLLQNANTCIEWLEDKLKSLRPQNHWKPTEEQMKELRKYSDNVVLRNLFYSLKKLQMN